MPVTIYKSTPGRTDEHIISVFRDIKGYPVRVNSNGASHDKEAAMKLWQLSEKLTELKN